jgi:hypothetical protein
MHSMTLRNMLGQGIRSLAIYCGAQHCHHQAVLDVSAFADDVTVPAFGPRMICTVCGAIGGDARPNWNERPQGYSDTRAAQNRLAQLASLAADVVHT